MTMRHEAPRRAKNKGRGERAKFRALDGATNKRTNGADYGRVGKGLYARQGNIHPLEMENVRVGVKTVNDERRRKRKDRG